MNTRDNVQTLQDLFTAAFSGDLEVATKAIGDVLHPDVLVKEPPFLPWGGEHRGIEAFFQLFGQIASRTLLEQFEVTDIFGSGDRCMVLYRVPFRTAGEPVWMDICELYIFRDGKVVEFQPFYFDQVPRSS